LTPIPQVPSPLPSSGLAALLADLPSSCSDTLHSLYARQPQLGEHGQSHPIDATTRITPEEGLELRRLAAERQATSLLEIGLAYGFSSQYLLAALHPRGGRLVAIDPYQSSDWHGVGRTLAQRTAAALTAGSPAADAVRFEWIPKPSHQACPQLEAADEHFDLIFIDGYHRFDDVLIDVTLAARLCRPGGVLVLHDLWLPSVRAVVSFLEANRSDLQRLPTPCRNLGVFQVVASDQRNWDHFVAFTNGGEPWIEDA